MHGGVGGAGVGVLGWKMYRWQVVMAGRADGLFADQPSSSFSPRNYVVPPLQDVGEPEEGISCSGLRSWTINHALGRLKSTPGRMSAPVLFVWTPEFDCACCQQIIYVPLSVRDESFLQMVGKW